MSVNIVELKKNNQLRNQLNDYNEAIINILYAILVLGILEIIIGVLVNV